MTKVEAEILNCLQVLLWALDRLLEIGRLSCRRERLSPGESRLVPVAMGCLAAGHSNWRTPSEWGIDRPHRHESVIPWLYWRNHTGEGWWPTVRKTMPYGYRERNHRPQCRELEWM